MNKLIKPLFKLFLILLISSLGACNLAPVFQKPDQEAHNTFKYKSLADSLSSISLDTAWWSYFEDSTLNHIINEVSLNNNNLKAALFNFERSAKLTRIERSALLPEVDVTANTSRTVVSENAVQRFQSNNFSNYSLQGLASYQIDLWGQLRNSYEAAVIDAEINLLEYYNMLSVLRAQAASEYINIRQLDTQIALYDSTIRLRERSLQIANLNYEAGASDALDPARAETQLRTAQAQRWTLRNQRARFENALAILMGKEPANFSLPDMPLDSLPPIFPSKVPSEVLTKRPDVWIALKTMEAENMRIGVARANLYPSINLSAETGFQGRSFENLLTPQSFSWTIAGGLLQPVFNYGRNKALVEASYRRYEQVSSLYQQSVLNAFEEVENELANIYYLNTQYGRQAQTVEAATRTADLARQRYEAGLVSYLEVVDAERTALLNQVDAVGIIGQLYQSMINLSLASGGNWEQGAQLYTGTEEESLME